MITVDNQCRDILASYWLTNTNDGKDITKKFKDKLISRVEYLEYIYKQTEAWIAMLSEEDLIKFLSKQEYFDFNVDRQLAKVTDTSQAAFLAEPIIIKRIDSDGNCHFLLDAFKKSEDTFIKQLPLNPNKYEELLEKLESANLYCMGMNWAKKPDSPSILIFGEEVACKDLKVQLEKTYGINR